MQAAGTEFPAKNSSTQEFEKTLFRLDLRPWLTELVTRLR